MRNVFFYLVIGILLLGCSEENPSGVFANSANGDSSSSVIELSSSDIANSSSSKDFAISSSSFGAISNSTEISSSSWPQYSYGQLIDERDGQVYKTVKIGDQWWMAENLNYAYIKPMETNFVRNGSTSFCYNNEPDSCKKYGRLYMWDATMDCVDKDIDEEFECNEYHDDNFNTHGICPENWHIPSVNEWKTLQNIVNNFATDLKSTSSWLDDGNGSDILGFGILPAGYYMNYEGRKVEFAKIGQQACFWTPRQTTNLLDCPYCYQDYAFPICFSSTNKNFLSFKQELKIYAFSIRCIKD